MENPSLLDHVPRDFVKIAEKYSSKGFDLFHLNPRMIERQNALIAETVHKFFQSTEAFRHVDLDMVVKAIGEFRNVFFESPVDVNSGGANFPSGINLFLMTRCLAPTLIVESGVFKGQSSYFLSRASSNATIHAFDPDLKAAVRTPGVNYHESDWAQSDVRCGAGAKGLGFFDDHQNQAKRVLQAFERGFKYIIVDDSWPMESITGCGSPPIPTIDMVINESLELDEVVKWVEFGKMWTYVHTVEMRDLCSRARRLIRAAYEVPSLYRETGIAPTSAYKFVELA